MTSHAGARRRPATYPAAQLRRRGGESMPPEVLGFGGENGTRLRYGGLKVLASLMITGKGTVTVVNASRSAR